MLAHKVGLMVMYYHVEFESPVFKTSDVIVVKQDVFMVRRTGGQTGYNTYWPHKAEG